MELLNSFARELNNKPTWSSKELIPRIHSITGKLIHELSQSGKIDSVGKKVPTNTIKKYDVVYVGIEGAPHYVLIYRVSQEVAIGVMFSSKDKAHSIHQINEDRRFAGGYACNNLVTISLDEAFDNFVRVFESKREANIIFDKVKNHLSEALAKNSKVFKSQITRISSNDGTNTQP
jgi:hypothetical protein